MRTVAFSAGELRAVATNRRYLSEGGVDAGDDCRYDCAHEADLPADPEEVIGSTMSGSGKMTISA